MIQNLLDELKEKHNFGPEQLADIKGTMIHYAMAACMDSEVRKECFEVAAEQNT